MLYIDEYSVDSFVPVAGRFGDRAFGFVVTPNVDHLARLHEQGEFRAAYDDATFTLLDSRVLRILLRWTHGLRPPVCTGSDLTERLLSSEFAKADKVLLVGGSPAQAEELKRRFGLLDLHHYNPPMGFIRDARAVEETLQYIEAQSPFRFCFLAVGSPQQEIIARRLYRRGKARGLALCVGAAVDFLTGKERRAPVWMQNLALEWLYRLLNDPRRLAYRYLVRGPASFWMLNDTPVALRRQAAV